VGESHLRKRAQPRGRCPPLTDVLGRLHLRHLVQLHLELRTNLKKLERVDTPVLTHRVQGSGVNNEARRLLSNVCHEHICRNSRALTRPF